MGRSVCSRMKSALWRFSSMITLAAAGPRIDHGGADAVGEAHLAGGLRTVAGIGRAVVEHDRLGPLRDGGVDELVRNLGKRLVPGDALPLALPALTPALERVEQPRGTSFQVAVTGSLLATARVEVGHVGAR